MKLWKSILLSILILSLFVSCADTVPYEVLVNDAPYGFWGGLWHGICFPISFIGSVFMEDVSIYAINNTGGWYDFGFWLGVGGLSTGVLNSSGSSSS